MHVKSYDAKDPMCDKPKKGSLLTNATSFKRIFGLSKICVYMCVISKQCTKTHWYWNIPFQLSTWNEIQNLVQNPKLFTWKITNEGFESMYWGIIVYGKSYYSLNKSLRW